MKILLTCDPEIPVPPGLYGGIERIVEVLVNNFTDQGHQVTLCANSASKVPCTLVGWKGIKSQNITDTIKNTLQLTRLIIQEKFDIVHSFSRLAYMTPVMPFDVLKIMSYQREPSVKQVTRAVKLSKKGTMVFTGCSNYISQKISSVADVHTIYNCVPIEKYNGTLRIDDDAPLVFLGRVEEVKGAHIAVEVAKASGKRLIIAGNIPQGKEAYFEKSIHPFLNDRITYIGPVNDEQKNTLLGNALAFLMPIQWNEPFGIVMAEAMACGTPVIGFPFGSVPEVVQNGINGFVCNTVQEMTDAINHSHTLDRAKIRIIAETNYSSIKITNDYLALYSNLINRKQKA